MCMLFKLVCKSYNILIYQCFILAKIKSASRLDDRALIEICKNYRLPELFNIAKRHNNFIKPVLEAKQNIILNFNELLYER